MKASLRLVVVSILLSGLMALPQQSLAAAKPAAGLSCSKLGATYVPKSLQCIKVGRKKVWAKRSLKFSAAIPIKLPVSATGPITWANAADKWADIPQVAFQDAQALMSRNKSVGVQVDIATGPNTVSTFPGGDAQIRSAISRTAKFFSGYSQSPYISILLYSTPDVDWAIAKRKEIAKARHYQNANDPQTDVAGNCQQQIVPGQFTGSYGPCNGADAGAILASNDATMNIGINGKTDDIDLTSGNRIAHEYTHTVSAAQWIGNKSCKNQNGLCNRNSAANSQFSPCWLFEGLPNAASRGANSLSFAAYQQVWSGVAYGWGPTTITDYTESSLRAFLLNQSAPTCYQNNELYKLGYSIGALTTQALMAIGGSQSPMALFALGADGYDFPTAFKKVYGLSWSDASNVLAKVLASEYAAAGPAPK